MLKGAQSCISFKDFRSKNPPNYMKDSNLKTSINRKNSLQSFIKKENENIDKKLLAIKKRELVNLKRKIFDKQEKIFKID